MRKDLGGRERPWRERKTLEGEEHLLKEAPLSLQTSLSLRELPPRAPALAERRFDSLCLVRVLLGEVFGWFGRCGFFIGCGFALIIGSLKEAEGLYGRNLCTILDFYRKMCYNKHAKQNFIRYSYRNMYFYFLVKTQIPFFRIPYTNIEKFCLATIGVVRFSVRQPHLMSHNEGFKK